MFIDLSSRAFDDKSEYSKIQLVGDSFKELNLSPEEELIVKKYLYYSERVPEYYNLTKAQVSLFFQLLIQMVFLDYNKECALRILACLADDLAKKNMKRAWIASGNISGVYSYLYECEKEKKEKGGNNRSI